MNFTKTVPTKSGVYEGQLACDGSPRVLIWHPPGDRLLAVAECKGVPYVSGYDMPGNYLWGEQLKQWPRIEPPQPVPGEVMDAVKYIYNNLPGFKGPTTDALKRICDYIKSIAPPEVPPLPRRFRGKHAGDSCRGVLFASGRIIIESDGGSVSYNGRDFTKIDDLEWIDGEQT